MQTLKYHTGERVSEVFVGLSWTEVKELINPDHTIIITDSNIKGIYGKDFPDCKTICLAPGESSKSLDSIETIIKELLRMEVDRSWFILGIGGGVICDISGFVASIYMRGISFGFVSTSLLSQLDASTGGKNGVNCSGYKNVIGCFTQPKFVICDPEQLKSLPEDEFVSGLGELVKHALIDDSDLFEYLELNAKKVVRENTELMENLVSRSVAIKIAIVEQDERERDLRRLLNFGHSLGHAIESVTKKKHGFAVAEGIYFSFLYAYENNMINKGSLERLIGLFRTLSLMDSIPVMREEYIQPLLRDKKRDGVNISFVIPKSIGSVAIIHLALNDLIGWMNKKIKNEG